MTSHNFQKKISSSKILSNPNIQAYLIGRSLSWQNFMPTPFRVQSPFRCTKSTAQSKFKPTINHCLHLQSAWTQTWLCNQTQCLTLTRSQSIANKCITHNRDSARYAPKAT